MSTSYGGLAKPSSKVKKRSSPQDTTSKIEKKKKKMVEELEMNHEEEKNCLVGDFCYCTDHENHRPILPWEFPKLDHHPMKRLVYEFFMAIMDKFKSSILPPKVYFERDKTCPTEVTVRNLTQEEYDNYISQETAGFTYYFQCCCRKFFIGFAKDGSPSETLSDNLMQQYGGSGSDSICYSLFNHFLRRGHRPVLGTLGIMFLCDPEIAEEVKDFTRFIFPTVVMTFKQTVPASSLSLKGQNEIIAFFSKTLGISNPPPANIYPPVRLDEISRKLTIEQETGKEDTWITKMKHIAKPFQDKFKSKNPTRFKKITKNLTRKQKKKNDTNILNKQRKKSFYYNLNFYGPLDRRAIVHYMKMQGWWRAGAIEKFGKKVNSTKKSGFIGALEEAFERAYVKSNRPPEGESWSL